MADLPIQLHIKLILLLTISIPDDHMQALLVYPNVHTLLGHVLGQDSNLHHSLGLEPLMPATPHPFQLDSDKAQFSTPISLLQVALLLASMTWVVMAM